MLRARCGARQKPRTKVSTRYIARCESCAKTEFPDIFVKKIGFRDLVKGASEPFGPKPGVIGGTLRVRK